MIKRHGIIGLLTLIFMIMGFILPVQADTGPKPSLTIRCRGFSEGSYVTVLSTVKNYGPNSPQDAIDFDVRDREDPSWFERAGVQKEIYQAFANEAARLKESGEELYFWGVVTPCEKEYLFGYWPPEEFRILIYEEDSGTFILSEETYTRQAFRTVLYCEYENGQMSVSDISRHELSTHAVIARILLTIVIEYLVGFAFIKYTRGARIAVVAVNILTQVLLNTILSLTEFKYGYGMPRYYLILLVTEAAIVVIEWLIYRGVIPKDKLKKPLEYSFAANAASLIIGLALQMVMPRLFL